MTIDQNMVKMNVKLKKTIEERDTEILLLKGKLNSEKHLDKEMAEYIGEEQRVIDGLRIEIAVLKDDLAISRKLNENNCSQKRQYRGRYLKLGSWDATRWMKKANKYEKWYKISVSIILLLIIVLCVSYL